MEDMQKVNVYRQHAMLEFKAAGWLNDDMTFKDDMQQMICEHVMKLLDVFDDEGHSGSTAPYAVNLFKKLALFEPIVPLTGEDWEWREIDFGASGYQNIRCSHVFKDTKDGPARDINAILFWEWAKRPLWDDEEGYPGERVYKSHYRSKGCAKEITFPYTPTVEEVYRWVEDVDDYSKQPPQNEEGFL